MHIFSICTAYGINGLANPRLFGLMFVRDSPQPVRDTAILNPKPDTPQSDFGLPIEQAPVGLHVSGTDATDVRDDMQASGTLESEIPSDENDTSGYVTTAIAAERLGVDSRTIRRWFSSEKIRGKLESHRLMILASDIERLSKNQQRTLENFAPDSLGHDRDMSGTDFVDVEVSGTDRDALIEKLANQLVAAASRASWLECELQNSKKELLLLPDLQSKAEDLERARQENEALKKHIQEIELNLARERNTWWNQLKRLFKSPDTGIDHGP